MPVRVGNKYHMLTVLERYPKRRALCRCDCGNEIVVFENNISRAKPNTTSCGCVWREGVHEYNKKHGMATRGAKTPEYRTWCLMKNRCYNKATPLYAYYGARGISVCDKWRNSFEAFYDDMGEKPSASHTLDRIDNDKNYSPENCRWATKQEQAMNRRKRGTVKPDRRTICRNTDAGKGTPGQYISNWNKYAG